MAETSTVLRIRYNFHFSSVHFPFLQDWVSSSRHLHYGLSIPWPVTAILAEFDFKDSFREAHPDPVTEPGKASESERLLCSFPQETLTRRATKRIPTAGNTRRTGLTLSFIKELD